MPITDVRGGTDYEGWAVRCEGCGLVRLAPLPSPEDIGRYYPDGYILHDARAITEGSERAIRRRRWLSAQGPLRSAARSVYNLLAFRSLPSGSGRLLDVGAGIGQYVADMETVGWEAQGVEPSSAAVELAQRAGRSVRQGDVFSAHLDHERFDLISFWHVLEHLYDPVAALERTRTLLAPGGQVLIAVPNWDAWMRGRVGSAWWGLEAPRHIHHFTARTLKATLQTAGFAVDHVGPKARGSMIAGSLAVQRSQSKTVHAPPAHAGHWALDLALATLNRTDTIWASARAA